MKSIYIFKNGANYGACEMTKTARDKSARNTARIIGTEIDWDATVKFARLNQHRAGASK